MARHHILSWWMPIAALGILLALLILIFLRYQKRPVIDGISTISAAQGDVIELTGQFFGKQNESSRVMLGSRQLNSPSILEWKNDRIKIRVPRRDGAVLVKIQSRSGLSNGVVLGDTKRFPKVEYGPWLPGSPYVEYIQPPDGGPGTLVSLLGKAFGNKQGDGKIWMNNKDSSSLFEKKEPNLNLYEEVTEIRLWADSELRFWVPEKIISGNVFVVKGGRYSNPAYFERQSDSATVQTGKPVRWSLMQRVRVSKPGAFPGNSLYLRVPKPVSGLGQSTAVVLGVAESQSLLRNGNLDVYRLDELKPGETREIIRQTVVATSSILIEGNPGTENDYDRSRPSISASLGSDRWVKPNQVTRRAKRITNGKEGDWNKAQAVYVHVTDTLEPIEENPGATLKDYLDTGEADSFGYSLYFCSMARAVRIPARPVGGIIVLEDGSSQHWWWAEFWQEGLGWIPVDPALGDTGTDSFGKLDENHIAFSRGISASTPLQPHTITRESHNQYSLQEIYEEIAGNLHSYLCSWPVPEVISMYRD